MTPRIESLTEKKLVGNRVTMSLANNRSAELWSAFMTRRSEIADKLSDELFSVQVYHLSYFSDFKPANVFEKWAAVEVSDFDKVPADMETFVLTGGLYAVFEYKGPSADPSIFQFIFRAWLPGSEYDLDDRAHFEVLGEKYKNNDPSSEEEIWIPVKLKDNSPAV